MGENEYIECVKRMIKNAVKNKADGEYELRFYVKVRDKEIDELSFEKETFFSPIDRAAGFTTPGKTDIGKK